MIVRDIHYSFQSPIALQPGDVLTINMQNDWGLRPHGILVNGVPIKDGCYLADFNAEPAEEVNPAAFPLPECPVCGLDLTPDGNCLRCLDLIS